MLSKDEILMILNLLAQRTVVEPSNGFPFRIVAAHGATGYNDDPAVGQLQAKLSIMLEATVRRGRG